MRVSEEPADHVRKLLQSTQSANSLSLEIIFAHDDPATDPIVLHVVPDPFIRVQIWRVRWQVKYFQASVRLVLGELLAKRQKSSPSRIIVSRPQRPLIIASVAT